MHKTYTFTVEELHCQSIAVKRLLLLGQGDQTVFEDRFRFTQLAAGIRQFNAHFGKRRARFPLSFRSFGHSTAKALEGHVESSGTDASPVGRKAPFLQCLGGNTQTAAGLGDLVTGPGCSECQGSHGPADNRARLQEDAYGFLGNGDTLVEKVELRVIHDKAKFRDKLADGDGHQSFLASSACWASISSFMRKIARPRITSSNDHDVSSS